MNKKELLSLIEESIIYSDLKGKDTDYQKFKDDNQEYLKKVIIELLNLDFTDDETKGKYIGKLISETINNVINDKNILNKVWGTIKTS